ncbi:hypothetical protein ACX80R_11730 [Paeniglutamicibacter antarcticus]
MPADKDAASEELAVMMAAEMPRARTEMRIVHVLWAVAGVALVAAVILWVFVGGRQQYISRNSGYDSRVLIPAWLALTGLLSAGAATVLFMIRLMRGALGNIVQRQVRK